MYSNIKVLGRCDEVRGGRRSWREEDTDCARDGVLVSLGKLTGTHAAAVGYEDRSLHV